MDRIGIRVELKPGHRRRVGDIQVYGDFLRRELVKALAKHRMELLEFTADRMGHLQRRISVSLELTVSIFLDVGSGMAYTKRGLRSSREYTFHYEVFRGDTGKRILMGTHPNGDCYPQGTSHIEGRSSRPVFVGFADLLATAVASKFEEPVAGEEVAA